MCQGGHFVAELVVNLGHHLDRWRQLPCHQIFLSSSSFIWSASFMKSRASAAARCACVDGSGGVTWFARCCRPSSHAGSRRPPVPSLVRRRPRARTALGFQQGLHVGVEIDELPALQQGCVGSLTRHATTTPPTVTATHNSASNRRATLPLRRLLVTTRPTPSLITPRPIQTRRINKS